MDKRICQLQNTKIIIKYKFFYLYAKIFSKLQYLLIKSRRFLPPPSYFLSAPP